MIVNILVPTYNRTHFVALQLLNLHGIRNALGGIGIDVKVIVSDNHSTPPIEIPEAFKDFVQLIKPKTHLNSGEENLIFALSQCTGEYIWTLSDDDAPIQHNVVALFKQILQTKPDFVVANSSAYLKDGRTVHSQTICSDASKIQTLPDFVASTGLWYVLTGFSGLIVRREPVQKQISRFASYFSASKIYSYAVFLLEIFWSNKFMFFNSPIVLATQNEYGDNWYRMAMMEGVFHRFFWTTGFIRQLNLLKQARDVPSGFFARVVDQGLNSRFPLLCGVATNALKQILEDMNPVKGSSRPMSQTECEEIYTFLCAEEPRMMLILAPLIKTHTISKISPQQIALAIAQLSVFNGRFFDLFYVKSFCGWNIYFFDNVYRAVPEDHEGEMMRQLRDIAPLSSEWHIVASKLDELEQQLCTHSVPSINLAPHRPSFVERTKYRLRLIAKTFTPMKLAFSIINRLPRAMSAKLWKRFL